MPWHNKHTDYNVNDLIALHFDPERLICMVTDKFYLYYAADEMVHLAFCDYDLNIKFLNLQDLKNFMIVMNRTIINMRKKGFDYIDNVVTGNEGVNQK